MNIKKIINQHIKQAQAEDEAKHAAYVALCKATKNRAEELATELQPFADYGFSFHVYQHYRNAYVITVSLRHRTYCTIYPIVPGGEQLRLYNRFDVNRYDVAVMRNDRLECMNLEQLVHSFVGNIISYQKITVRKAA
jgi:hypothetical protein